MVRKKPGKWFEDENIQRIPFKGKNIYWKKKKKRPTLSYQLKKNQKTRNWLVKSKKPQLGLLSYDAKSAQY